MTDLPPELAQIAVYLDAQPAHVQDIFRYCLCLMMVEAQKIKLVETRPGENGPVCVFETEAGDTFSIAKPAIDKEQEAALIGQLKEILTDEWGGDFLH